MTMSTIVKQIKTNILLAMTIAVFAMPVFAQDQQDVTPPPPERRADPEKVQQLMQKIEKVKHEKLRETLNLDDESAKKFFDMYKPAEHDIIGLVKQRNEEERRLVQLTQGDFKDGDVDPTIANIKSLNDKIEQRYGNLNDQLKSVLNPRQRAKLLVFEHEFNRRVREKIRQRREQWRENHSGRPLPKLRRGRPIDPAAIPQR